MNGDPSPAERDSGEGAFRRRLALTIATWFGCGYSPVAPGTAGSAAALILAAYAVAFLGWGRMELAMLTAAMLYPGIWAGGAAAEHSGRKDPGLVVIDEVIGQWIALLGATAFNWKSFAAAFVLFRAFDIWKPGPIRRLEAMPGGQGIMADDVGAGVLAALVLFAAGCFNLY